MQTEKKPRKKNYINNADLLIQLAASREKGRMTEQLAAMLQELCARYAKKGNFVGYCVDEQTTALTKRGWLSYETITTDDEILSYDIDSQNLVWSKILDLYIGTYDGKMHFLTGEGIDALVTPEHKFVSVECGLKRVEDINSSEHIVLMPNVFCDVKEIDFHGGLKENNVSMPTYNYSSTVWCPQTEYGTFICKRNCCMYITGNTYNEDMQAYAMMMLVKSWDKFDPQISSNPFAFYTQCTKNFYRQYLNQEKKHRDIRDELMVTHGLTPSFRYQSEHGCDTWSDRNSSIDDISYDTTIHEVNNECNG